MVDEEEFTKELRKGIPGRGNSLCNHSKREPDLSSAIASGSMELECSGGNCSHVCLFAPRLGAPHPQPSVWLAADTPLMFVT